MKNEPREKIADFYRRRRRLPSYAEIMELYGFRSKNSAFRLVQKLIKDGVVAKDREGKLVPDQLTGGARMLGLVEAGFPSAAEEELSDTISLDEFLIKNKEASYILRVKGDSMIDAAICDGDMVIVERTNNVKDGQIVIADVDGEWTIKYYRQRGGEVYLEPANKKFKPIYPKETLKIAAVVRAVIRKY